MSETNTDEQKGDRYYVDINTPSPRVRQFLALKIGEFMGVGAGKDFDQKIEELYTKDKEEGTLQDEEAFFEEQKRNGE